MHGDGSATFWALGPLEVRRSGQPVELGSPKQRAALGVLVDAIPRAVSIERLVEELWPERPPRDPLRSIQVYASALRGAIGGPLLVKVGSAYRLEVDPDRVDTVRFVQAAGHVRHLVRQGLPEAAVSAADDALALWRGEAWQGLEQVPSLAQAAARLAEKRLDVIADSVLARLALGRHRELVSELEGLVHRYPLREDLRGHLMLALHRCRRQVDALATYDAGRRVKAEETGLDPGSELRDLHARILADDPALTVDDADLRARRHLPAPTTRLVGRDREVVQLTELLGDPGCRLVTLTGPGGIGKTRLGLRVADDLASAFPDGVWFVGLAGVLDQRVVPQSIADALGVDAVGEDFIDQLKRHVAGRTMLLLLDNFEQVDAAAPLLSDLLAAGRGCKILVTSRTRLRLYGEHVREVEPLGEDAATSLFAERARSVASWFDVTATDQIARVCRALDRIPLALELVAARVGDVPLSEMVAQLGERLELAGDGPRDHDPRQQSLRGAIGWSVDLLTEGQRAVFRRLGVFVGGFEADSAAEVALADSSDLEALVRASLVRRAPDGRLGMFEVIGDFAREQLATDEARTVSEAHGGWFLRMGEASVEGIRSRERAAWYARLDAERGNMRAALQWLAERAEQDRRAGDDLLSLASALGLFWYRTSPGTQDVAWLERALELAPDADVALRGRGHYALAICRGEQGRVSEALEHGRAAHRLVVETDDPEFVARVLNTLGGLLRDLGLAEEAVPMMEESILLRRELALPALPPTLALANRAMAAVDLGDLRTARECLEECLRDDDEMEVAMARRLLAEVAIDAGDPIEAEQHLRAAMPILLDSGQRYRLVECLDTLAALAVHRDLTEHACVLLAAADAAIESEGDVQVPADATLRERRTAAAIASMDHEVRRRATAQGAELTLERAVELATTSLL